MSLHFQYFLKKWRMDKFFIFCYFSPNFLLRLEKNYVIEKKHVKECNQLRLRQNLAFRFLCIFVRPRHSLSVTHNSNTKLMCYERIHWHFPKKFVKSSLCHTLLQIKLIFNICVCSEIELSINFNLSVLFFYPCLCVTDSFNTVFFLFPIYFGKNEWFLCTNH